MFDEDLGTFFEDFGIEVVFVRLTDDDPPEAEDVATATLIYNAPSSEINVYDRSFYDEKFYEAGVLGQSVSLHGVQADVALVTVGDIATPDGQGDWYVIAVEPDGTGLITIRLSQNTPT